MEHRLSNPDAAVPAELTACIVQTVTELRDEMVAMLRALARIPSLTSEEAQVQDEVERIMRGFGLSVDRWEPDAAELTLYEEHVGAFRYAGEPHERGWNLERLRLRAITHPQCAHRHCRDRRSRALDTPSVRGGHRSEPSQRARLLR